MEIVSLAGTGSTYYAPGNGPGTGILPYWIDKRSSRLRIQVDGIGGRN